VTGLALAASAFALTAAPANGAFPGRNGSLAFESTEYVCPGDDCSATEEIGSVIGILRPRAGARRKLPCSGSHADVNVCGDTAPTWSADGKRLLFECEGICLTTPPGPFRKLSLPQGAAQPAWSPEGDRLSFAAGGQIYTANLDGSNLHAIGPSNAASPAWSVGGQIAFERRRAKPVAKPDYENSDLWVMRDDGTHLRRLTSRGGESPSWSPTGQRLAFTRGPDVYLMGVGGHSSRRLTRRGGVLPAWSPDGRWIAYCVEGGNGFELPHYAVYRVRTGGGRRARVVRVACAPDWQPRPTAQSHG
jgi:Tol biopolymer transport system component